MTTTGQDVLNVVFQHLGPNLETAYFGLRYMDASHQPVLLHYAHVIRLCQRESIVTVLVFFLSLSLFTAMARPQ